MFWVKITQKYILNLCAEGGFNDLIASLINQSFLFSLSECFATLIKVGSSFFSVIYDKFERNDASSIALAFILMWFALLNDL